MCSHVGLNTRLGDWPVPIKSQRHQWMPKSKGGAVQLQWARSAQPGLPRLWSTGAEWGTGEEADERTLGNRTLRERGVARIVSELRGWRRDGCAECVGGCLLRPLPSSGHRVLGGVGKSREAPAEAGSTTLILFRRCLTFELSRAATQSGNTGNSGAWRVGLNVRLCAPERTRNR